MAIYHFSAKMISRSSGRSSVAASAYRAGERLTDHRQGLEHDYSNRRGVLYAQILAPDGTPEHLLERGNLWNEVESVERRKDAQLAREVTIALPHELTDAQRVTLVCEFVQSNFVDQGMIADVAIHAPGAEGDEKNHHAHVMLTTRTVDEDGFGGKDRSWNQTPQLEIWRENWAEHTNQRAAELGMDFSIDHRTLEAQHIEQVELQHEARDRGDDRAAQDHEINAAMLDRPPLPDIGWQAWSMEKRGIDTAAGDLWRQAHEKLDQVRELVAEMQQQFQQAYERVAEALVEQLQKLDFTAYDEVDDMLLERSQYADLVEELTERGLGDFDERMERERQREAQIQEREQRRDFSLEHGIDPDRDRSRNLGRGRGD
jgi:ATP-dependent exoDNAse (exonuclease V) alpha subunit